MSLRTRLSAGLVAVALVVAAAAWAVTGTTSRHLVAQIDEQLLALGQADRDGRPGAAWLLERRPLLTAAEPDGEPPERYSRFYEAVLLEDDSLATLFEPNVPGEDISPPALDPEQLRSLADEPFTVPAEDGDGSYRVLASPVGPTAMVVRALPLTDVDETVARLVAFQAVGLVLVSALLAAVGWWVVRLGIRPLAVMTDTADGIGDDDLSSRIPETEPASTEAGRLARTLNTMLDRLEGAVDARRRSEDRLRRFVSDASHELRTPVTTIRGYAELYRHGGLPPGESLDDAMRRTEEEAQRMSRLVEEMLTLAKLDEERTPERRPVDVTATVEDLVADARVTAPEHRIVEEVAAELWVTGDPDRLRQAFLNVVGNATTHTPPGTTVTVGARRDGDGIVVVVADDGPGIPAEHLTRVTERFYRADPARARSRGGSGLGLAIAESIVAGHGGSVVVDSADGGGTIVHLRLPTRPPGA